MKKIFSYLILISLLPIGMGAQSRFPIEKMHHLASLNTGYDSYIITPISRPDEAEAYPYFEAGIASKIKLMNFNSEKNGFAKPNSDLEISMYFLLRMYNEESSPIHPLSFEPGITYTHYLPSRTATSFNYFTFAFKHLSNGQKGEYFIPGTDTVNLQSGNFSTNYISMNYSRVNEVRGATFFQTYGLRLDGGIPNTVLSMEENLYNNYGQIRLMANFQFISPVISLFEKQPSLAFRTILRLENTYIAGDLSKYDDDEKDRYSFKGRLSLYPESGLRMGLYTQFYVGRDYYNLKFNDIFDVWSIGITYNL